MNEAHSKTTVVDIAAELERRDFARKFARLAKLADDYEVDLFTNPRRHLDRAYTELYRLHKALEAAYEALHPITCFGPPSIPTRPPDIGAQAFARNCQVEKIIYAALFPREACADAK